MKLSEVASDPKRKILVYGDAGTGKTCFAAGLPAPVYVADFDGKISSAASVLSESQIAGVEYGDFRLGIENDDPFARWEKKLVEIEAAIRSGTAGYNTVVLDSITNMIEAHMRHILITDRIKRPHPELPSQQDYHLAGVQFKAMIYKILSLPVHVVATGHVEKVKDDMTGEILHRIVVRGDKLPSWLPTVFEEVYYTFTEKVGTRLEYFAQTQTDHRFKCRTQLGLPAKMKLAWSSIEQAGKSPA